MDRGCCPIQLRTPPLIRSTLDRKMGDDGRRSREVLQRWLMDGLGNRKCLLIVVRGTLGVEASEGLHV